MIIDGNGLRVVKAYDSPEHGVTRTFQDVRLFDQITVWDNIMVTLTERRVFHSLFQRRSAERDDKARRILRSVGMWEKRDSLAMDLSYGSESCWRLAAPCLWTSERICSMSLSRACFPRCWESVKDIMKRLRDEGHAIVFISHNMDIVRELSDHIIVLDSGRLLTEGEVEEALTRPEVIDAYLGLSMDALEHDTEADGQGRHPILTFPHRGGRDFLAYSRAPAPIAPMTRCCSNYPACRCDTARSWR